MALALSAALPWFESDVLPLLDACRSRAGVLTYPLERLAGRPWIRPNFALLALARLERVSDFEQRAAAVLSRMARPEVWLQRALAPIRAWRAPGDENHGHEA